MPASPPFTFRRYRQAQQLELAHAAYHSLWFLPAIRELAARRDFVAGPAWIAGQLLPPIAPAEAANALEILERLGLLVRTEDGRLVQGQALLTTGAESRHIHLRAYHRVMLERAAASLDLVSAAERDISSLTVCLGPRGLARFKERIARFRRELLELSALEDDPEQVVQLNFQLFPLSRRREEGESP